MRERKYIKFRVDMYDDTKFKIIDMRPERDLIHYIWTRLVTLAGKVNLEGHLYMSKNIPYTIETLAIEFNRGIDQIKLALDVFIELEMVELIEDNVYRVKNFAKHQNIKVKEKTNSKDKEEDAKNKKDAVEEDSIHEIYEDKEAENKISQNDVEEVKNDDRANLEITHKDINKIDGTMSNPKINNNSQDSIPILLETRKNTKVNKKKKKDTHRNRIKDTSLDITDEEEVKDNKILCFYDADEGRIFGEGERVVREWSF